MKLKLRFARLTMFVYIRLIRSWLSPLWYHLRTFRVRPRTNLWEDYKMLSAKEFEARVKRVKYTGDPWGGSLDYTVTDPDIFFAPGLPDCDCDDVAYMWYLWAEANRHEAWLIVVMDGLSIKSSHYFTVFRQGPDYILANYTIDMPRRSLDACTAQFEKNYLTKWGRYVEPVIFIDKHCKEREEV